MKTKRHIDKQVSLELGVPVHRVAKITTNFIAQMSLALAEDGEFDLTNFATFRLRTIFGPAGKLVDRYPNGVRRIYVRLYKKRKLKKLLDATAAAKELTS